MKIAIRSNSLPSEKTRKVRGKSEENQRHFDFSDSPTPRRVRSKKKIGVEMWKRREKCPSRIHFQGWSSFELKSRKLFFFLSPTQQKMSCSFLKFFSWLKFEGIKQAWQGGGERLMVMDPLPALILICLEHSFWTL